MPEIMNQNKDTIKLEVGKLYVARCGLVSQEMQVAKDPKFPFFAVMSDGHTLTWTDDGEYDNTPVPHKYDLVAALPEVSPSEPDPKGSAGDKKTPMQFLPLSALDQVSHVMKLGAKKYGFRNWVTSDGVEINTYKGAILRHLMQYCDGEDVDPESGQSHIAHIAASCLIILDAEAHDKLIDNR